MKPYLFVLVLFVLSQRSVAQVEHVQFTYPNGKVSSEGQMVDGKPEGYWKNYYEDGTLKSEGNRKSQQLDSLWSFYSPEGKLTQRIAYAEGKKNGIKTTFAEDGVIVKEEEFLNDSRFGTTKLYYASGKLKESIPLDTLGKGREQGTGYEFDEEDGRIVAVVQYSNGYVSGRERINRKDKFNQKQGVWKEFFPNGVVSLEGRYKNDKKHGYFKTFDESGNLLETLKYEEGILIPDPQELAKLDIKREYYPNAQVKSVGRYNKGVKEGVHRQFTETGQVSASKIYSNGKVIGEGIVDAEGKRQGPWKEFYEPGELRSEGKYKDGLREGEWKFYYKDGKEEQRGAYRRGKPDGEWKWTHPKGITWREETFYDGLEEGMAIEYNDTGKVVTKGEYLSGEREGKWLIDIGDEREEGYYVAGQRNDMWKHFYPSGKLRFEGKYTQGMEEGKHTYYYESGQIERVGMYKFGQKEGDWTEFSVDGLPMKVLTYKQGEVVKVDGEKVETVSESED